MRLQKVSPPFSGWRDEGKRALLDPMKTAYGAVMGLMAVLLGLTGLADARADAMPASKAFKSAPAIVSPDVEQTWPQGNLLNWSFRLGTDRKSFTVVVTYGNDLFADRETPQAQEDHFFRFPSVVYSPAGHGFYWKNPRGGAPVLVAWRGGSSTALVRNAIVVVFNHGGKLVAAIKVAPPGTVFATTLTQVASASRWSLQGLIQH